MVFSEQDKDAHQALYQDGDRVDAEKHKGHFSHDAIAGAAAFEAIKAWNNHQEKNGKPQQYETAKEIAGGLAAAAITHLFETRGLDAIDGVKRRRAEEEAKKKAEAAVAQQY